MQIISPVSRYTTEKSFTMTPILHVVFFAAKLEDNRSKSQKIKIRKLLQIKKHINKPKKNKEVLRKNTEPGKNIVTRYDVCTKKYPKRCNE